jgi:hypothetical protein
MAVVAARDVVRDAAGVQLIKRRPENEPCRRLEAARAAAIKRRGEVNAQAIFV